MKTKNLIIIILSAVLLILLAFYLTNSRGKSFENCETMPAKEMNIKGHQNLALHIHPRLKIIINRVQQEIPGNIGLSQTIMKPIHTHDTSGKLHTESPCPREFTLGDFFEIWGKNFNSTCIFEYCANETSILKTYVNGQENFAFENYIMRDGDEIVIEYILKES